MNDLINHFTKFRNNTVGIEQTFLSPYGEKKIIYADWIASGRLYRPIEEKLLNEFGPLVGNTHSESSFTGAAMTNAYHEAKKIIKQHFNASKDDVIIVAGSGMTGMINKFQRIIGVRVPEQVRNYVNFNEKERPVVFVTHMEHHSNHTSWLESLAEIVILKHDELGFVDMNDLEDQLKKYRERQIKIGAFTACSNVTGVETDYHEMAKLVHQYGGYVCIDFACSAPYEKIDMHPPDPLKKLDVITFSPHKFLGGPGSPGVLIFDSKLYHNRIPDNPGGGTVYWTNPWDEHKFVDNIEAREDGGTPPFLQTIKAALAIKLKEEMNPELMIERERDLVKKIFEKLPKIEGMKILAGHIQKRLGAISFNADKIHYNLLVKILNDRFGIQSRGGCSCAGTYAHYLLNLDQEHSRQIKEKISHGDLSEKPGWIRISLHPTMTDEDLDYIIDSIEESIENIKLFEKDYTYSPTTNEYCCNLTVKTNGAVPSLNL